MTMVTTQNEPVQPDQKDSQPSQTTNGNEETQGGCRASAEEDEHLLETESEEDIEAKEAYEAEEAYEDHLEVHILI